MSIDEILEQIALLRKEIDEVRKDGKITVSDAPAIKSIVGRTAHILSVAVTMGAATCAAWEAHEAADHAREARDGTDDIEEALEDVQETVAQE